MAARILAWSVHFVVIYFLANVVRSQDTLTYSITEESPTDTFIGNIASDAGLWDLYDAELMQEFKRMGYSENEILQIRGKNLSKKEMKLLLDKYTTQLPESRPENRL